MYILDIIYTYIYIYVNIYIYISYICIYEEFRSENTLLKIFRHTAFFIKRFLFIIHI